MPRPRVHAHLTINAIEKEIAELLRAGRFETVAGLIEICEKHAIPISSVKIAERLKQQSFSFVEQNGLPESEMLSSAQPS